MILDDSWLKVHEFHQAFSHPISDSPTLMPAERKHKRYKWMLEEINEFLEAESIESQSDAMIDLIYFALGTLVETGVRPGKLFDIVHNANMTKLWPDGKPRMNGDGKIIKPSGWLDPEPLISEEIRKQINQNLG
ncbi:HAD family hydrolase [Alkalimonas amylolytica]|uniref:Predicted phosphohydrolase, Cof family, HAD superfamily n=1 Tax=Alkalimonas amylolytica TaxID=152573 RepID=A0A1H3YH19_ALKAM|nr:HAD family hydrolase [Alkalimonas amylolytica]SEA10152.1 Predicted phosphohydrolase, Cof family, HAD superfamily [Alkalimonas amylolytica]